MHKSAGVFISVLNYIHHIFTLTTNIKTIINNFFTRIPNTLVSIDLFFHIDYGFLKRHNYGNLEKTFNELQYQSQLTYTYTFFLIFT